MRLFDAHCHLQDPRLLPAIGPVMARAREAGVAALVCCGAEVGDWDAVRDLAAAHQPVIASYGLHPWHVGGRPADWLDRLQAALDADPAAGVGEIGLDRALPDRRDEEQGLTFQSQLALAKDGGRAVTLHCRRAWGALLETLRRFGRLPRGFVVHSYSGSRELIEPLAALGGYFSYSGSVTYPGNRRSRESARAVPADRLLIETDAPDLFPAIGGGATGSAANRVERVNEPANLVHVLARMAELRGVGEEALATDLWTNGRRLFPGRDQ